MRYYNIVFIYVLCLALGFNWANSKTFAAHSLSSAAPPAPKPVPKPLGSDYADDAQDSALSPRPYMSTEVPPSVSANTPIAHRPSVESCDPSVYMQFYHDAEIAICLTRPNESCPDNWSKTLKSVRDSSATFLATGLAYGGLVSGGAVKDYYYRLHKVLTPDEIKKMAMVKGAIGDLKATLSDAVMDGQLIRFLNATEKTPVQEDVIRLLTALEKEFPEHQASVILRECLDVLPKAIFTRTLVGGTVLFGAIMAGVSLAGSAAVAYFSDEGSMGCESPYITKDPSDNCKIKYQMSSSVFTFMSLPEEARNNILAGDAAVCRYYKNFNHYMTKQMTPEPIQNISCGQNEVTYNVKLGKIPYHFDLTSYGDNVSRELKVTRLDGKNQTLAAVKEFSIEFGSEDGEPSFSRLLYHPNTILGSPQRAAQVLSWKQLTEANAVSESYVTQNYYPTFLKAMFNHKIYSAMIKRCCEIQDLALRQVCTDTLQQPAEPSVYREEKKILGDSPTE